MSRCVLQEHHAHGERDGGPAGVRRGMAQLPSRVPVGLQGGRVGQLPVELQHGVHRRVRPARAGVQPEDGQRQPGGETVPQDGRRHQGTTRHRGVGMGRRGHERGGQTGRPRDRLIIATVCLG